MSDMHKKLLDYLTEAVCHRWTDGLATEQEVEVLIQDVCRELGIARSVAQSYFQKHFVADGTVMVYTRETRDDIRWRELSRKVK